MEGLVNYSSEDELDDYPYSKVAIRERGGGGSGSVRNSVVLGVDSTGGPSKRRYERSRSDSREKDASPYRKGRDVGGERERFKSGNNDEDKYKSDKRAEKFRDNREKKDNRDARNYRDEKKDHDNGHKHDYKKHDDHKRHRDTKRDFKRENNDYNRDDKRHNRYDDKKTPYTSNYNKDRFHSSKPRYDDRKQFDDRTKDDRRSNEDKRGGGANFEDRRRDFNDRRNYDDRKSDRRNNDDRRPQRSFNEDRSNSYRTRRSGSPSAVPRNNSNKYDKDDYNTKRDRKHHSRSRSPKQSHVEKSNERDQTLVNSSQREGGEQHTESHPKLETTVAEKKHKPTARNFEALLSLPLSETSQKQPNVVTVPPISIASSSNTTTAVVQLPSYYNPNVINPNKYVEQMQKRKLIWGAKKAEDSASKWGHAQFSQDQDGKVASKFMRLMGIKSGAESSTSPNESEKKSPTSSTSPSNNIDVKSREAMFSTMEQQYEVARQVTHTMRGVGLGFGSQPRPY